MSQRHPSTRHAGALVRQLLIGVGFTVVVVILLLALAGKFHRKIETPRAVRAAAGRPVGAAQLVEARILRVPTTESAVGTIRAVHEIAIASKLLAKVLELNVKAGQDVRAGDVLVRLDDVDLKAQLRQAEAGVDSAKATLELAQIEYGRVKPLYEQGIEAKSAFDQVDTAVKTAQAAYERAQQASAQSQAVLDYATIRSPIDGKVVDKRIEIGDTASPGQVLVTLYDPTRMQLVASVREALTHRLKVGQSIGVRVDALAKTCEGQVSEIVPEAESASRTFSVKVTGPCPPGIYSGMFGRLLIPLDEEEAVVIPQAAVRRVGQLDIVEVAEPADPPVGQGFVLHRRIVQLGRTFGEDVQVLAGVRAGEKIALTQSAPAETVRG